MTFLPLVANVALDCNASSRAGNNNNGAVDFSGNNWVVNNVWIQHVTSAFWCAGFVGSAENCRTLSTWADGGNFNNVQSANGIGMNLTYSNNFVRGTGDDAMAINSVNLQYLWQHHLLLHDDEQHHLCQQYGHWRPGVAKALEFTVASMIWWRTICCATRPGISALGSGNLA